MTHTKTPWFLQKGFNTIYSFNGDTSGITTAIAKMSDHQVMGGHEEATANAEHIVKCVNEREVLENRIAELERVLDWARCSLRAQAFIHKSGECANDADRIDSVLAKTGG